MQAVETMEYPVHMWVPEAGDRFLVDTEANMGYLVREDGTYTSFPVVTGQRRNVYYIGRYYNATTPTRVWEGKELDSKWDRITFGESGRFLRLFYEGEDTAYGIHPYGYEDKMFAEDSRYQSMGCVIVRERVMDVILKTWELNDHNLSVITTYGIENLEEQITTLTQKTDTAQEHHG